MSEELFIDTFIYGNLKLITQQHNISFIRNNFDKLRESLEYKDFSCCWVMVVNISYLIHNRGVDKSFLIFIKELFQIHEEKFSCIYDSFRIDDNFAIIKAMILSDLVVFATSSDIYRNLVLDIKKIFEKEYKFLIDFGFYYNYNISADKWKPKWTLITKNSEISLYNIEMFTEGLFISSNIIYSDSMSNLLQSFTKRLIFLKNHSKLYFKEVIQDFINPVSKRIVSIFPLAELYSNYPEFVENFKEAYLPPLIKTREEFVESNVILSILPENVRLFILGFPYLTCGIPSISIQREHMLKFHEDPNEYFKFIETKYNEPNLKNRIFEGIKCANPEDDDEKPLNVLDHNVTSYNMDDTLVTYFENVYFVFNFPEFLKIEENLENHYNRQRMNFGIIKRMRTCIEKHKEMIFSCKLKGLKIKLDGNMAENYHEICENIGDYTFNTMHDIYSSEDEIIANLLRSFIS